MLYNLFKLKMIFLSILYTDTVLIIEETFQLILLCQKRFCQNIWHLHSFLYTTSRAGGLTLRTKAYPKP